MTESVAGHAPIGLWRFSYGDGFLGRLVRRLRPRAVVLVYHRVAEPEHDPFGLSVPPDRFAEHLDALQGSFRVESLEAVVESLPRRACGDRTVAVTFDDGYADNLHTAQPIAAARGIPITVFVSAGPVLDRKLFWWDELTRAVVALGDRTIRVDPGDGTVFELTGKDEDRWRSLRGIHRWLMSRPARVRDPILARILDEAGSGVEEVDVGRPLTPSELRAFAARPGVTVGAHSFTHPSLRALSKEEQLLELERGMARLREIAASEIALLAYPFGRPRDVDRTTMTLAKRAGYGAAFTTTESALTPGTVRRHRFALPRLTSYGWTADVLVDRVEALLKKA